MSHNVTRIRTKYLRGSSRLELGKLHLAFALRKAAWLMPMPLRAKLLARTSSVAFWRVACSTSSVFVLSASVCWRA